MNPEFLAKFTLGGNVAIVVLIKWFYGESSLCTSPKTPFQTERYSRPRHLAASFPLPAHAKNIKTPLPKRPIHWRTLYFQFTLFTGFDHSGDILRINSTNTSSHTRVSLLSRPWTWQIHLTESLHLPRYPVKATVPRATIQRYTLYINCGLLNSRPHT